MSIDDLPQAFGDCQCLCHRQKGVVHVAACCYVSPTALRGVEPPPINAIKRGFTVAMHASSDDGTQHYHAVGSQNEAWVLQTKRELDGSPVATNECFCPQHGNWISSDDVKRLTRELDVALNGEGAARQASLCDIVAQVRNQRWKLVRVDDLE